MNRKNLEYLNGPKKWGQVMTPCGGGEMKNSFTGILLEFEY